MKELKQGNIKKVKRKIQSYNKLIDVLWDERPSNCPLQRIEEFDETKRSIRYESNKCMFCGSNEKSMDILPYMFNTIKFIALCDKEECKDSYEKYKKGYSDRLNEFHKDMFQ
jgi:hypothetical protein